MIEKNLSYAGEVCALGSDFEGIINIEGTTAFVPFCLVGEKVAFRALKVKGGVAYGKAEKILTPAPERIAPPCPVFGKCGGCALQHAKYSAQLEMKREKVRSALKKIGGIEADISPCVPCEREYRYRNKLSMPIGRAKDGVELGFFAPRSHRVVPADDCLIQAEWVKVVIYSIKKFAAEQNLSGYSDDLGGDLRQVSVRGEGGKFIIVVVATKRINLKPLEKILCENFSDFTLLLNVNSSKTNAIFSNEWHICRGEGYIACEDMGVKYRAGANTFLQVNDDVRRKLYAKILDEADGEEVAIDLYSGGGMLTALLSGKCARSYGVEVVPEASRCADELKNLNGLNNMINICGKVEERVEEILKRESGRKKIIVCDPPRKGMERSAVSAVRRSGAEKVVLVSCNPATLARDLGLLCGALEERDGELVKRPADGVYEIKSITPFDMFPQTGHVETLVVLTLSPRPRA